MTFGAWIRGHRIAANLDATTLAEKVGISPHYLNDIQYGRKAAPADSIVISLCEWLHVSIAVGMFYAGRLAVDLEHVIATDAQIDKAIAEFRRAVLFPATRPDTADTAAQTQSPDEVR